MTAAGAAVKGISRFALILGGLLCLADSVPAAELLEFEFSRDQRRYTVRSEAYIDVPPEGVYAVLTDYEHLHRLSSLVTESRELRPTADGERRVYTLNEGCVAFFCRSVEKIERLVATPHSQIETTVIAAQSDLGFGVSRWQLRPEGRGTRLVYNTETQVGFWVPPVIGNYLLSRWLKKGANNALARIEYYAWHTLYDSAPAPAEEAVEGEQEGEPALTPQVDDLQS